MIGEMIIMGENKSNIMFQILTFNIITCFLKDYFLGGVIEGYKFLLLPGDLFN